MRTYLIIFFSLFSLQIPEIQFLPVNPFSHLIFTGSKLQDVSYGNDPKQK